MAALLINWCKIMFTQNNGSIRVRTGSCQGGAVSAHGQVSASADYEVVSSQSLLASNPSVRLEENTIYLNRREASFINKEVRRLLKAKLAVTERKKKQGIPMPPEPGKIAYAVYQ